MGQGMGILLCHIAHRMETDIICAIEKRLKGYDVRFDSGLFVPRATLSDKWPRLHGHRRWFPPMHLDREKERESVSVKVESPLSSLERRQRVQPLFQHQRDPDSPSPRTRWARDRERHANTGQCGQEHADGNSAMLRRVDDIN